jgi:hypothetical protein
VGIRRNVLGRDRRRELANEKRQLRAAVIWGNMYFSRLPGQSLREKDTDYHVVGDGVPVGRMSARSGMNNSLC